MGPCDRGLSPTAPANLFPFPPQSIRTGVKTMSGQMPSARKLHNGQNDD